MCPGCPSRDKARWGSELEQKSPKSPAYLWSQVTLTRPSLHALPRPSPSSNYFSLLCFCFLICFYSNYKVCGSIFQKCSPIFTGWLYDWFWVEEKGWSQTGSLPIGAQDVSALGGCLKCSIIKRQKQMYTLWTLQGKIFHINQEKQGDKYISPDTLRKDCKDLDSRANSGFLKVGRVTILVAAIFPE